MTKWYYSQKFLDKAYLTFLRLYVSSPFEPLINRDPATIEQAMTSYFMAMQDYAFHRITDILRRMKRSGELTLNNLSLTQIKELYQQFEQDYAADHRYPELGIEDDYTITWHSNALYNYWLQRLSS